MYYQIAQPVADSVAGDVHVRHVCMLVYFNFYRKRSWYGALIDAKGWVLSAVDKC